MTHPQQARSWQCRAGAPANGSASGLHTWCGQGSRPGLGEVHEERRQLSFVRVEAAREMPAPSVDVGRGDPQT